MNNCDEFGTVLLTELMLAIMSDGKWYSTTVLRKRIKPSSRGVITGTLSQLRNRGYLIRAKNPRNTGRPFHREEEAQYLYKSTFKEYDLSGLQRPRQFREHVRNKNVLPWGWRQILK